MLMPDAAVKYRGMRVTVFLLEPLRAGYLMNGAHVVLMKILRHLSELGTSIIVHHPGTIDQREPFTLMPGVRVEPLPPMLFQSRSHTPWADPMEHAAAVEQILLSASKSDAFYVHGANLPHQTLSVECPTTASVHDLVFHESVTGVLNFVRDTIVAVSGYGSACLRAVLARIRPVSDDTVRLIPNGYPVIDPAHLRSRIRETRATLGVAEDDFCIVHPHRPDPDKGIFEVLEALAILRDLVPARVFSRIRLLVPRWRPPWIGGDDPGWTGLAPEAGSRAVELGIDHLIHVHDRIGPDHIFDYFAAADATLCVGRFPEMFGNAHIESSLAGTPAVVARVAAQRTTVPESLVRKVDPGRSDQVAGHLAELVQTGERCTAKMFSYLRDEFSAQRMLDAYEEVILNGIRRPPARFLPQPDRHDPQQSLAVPPWAASLDSGFYHDYHGYIDDDRFLSCLATVMDSCSVDELCRAHGVTHHDIQRWLDGGLLMLNRRV